MNNANSEIDESVYLSGASLLNSIFEFGNSELIDSYKLAIQPQNLIKNSNSVGFLDIMQSAAQGLMLIQNNKTNREKLLVLLQKDILNQIKNGSLIPFGFKEPRNIQDKPIKIPADLFFSGEIHWDNSELKYKSLELTGIRLLKDLLTVIEIKSENSKIQEIKEIGNIKNQKLNFSNLDPELYIDENKAAELLGISTRTLQGWRSKGGGPEFSKIGKKSVRYKVSDLKSWCEDRKKLNTV